MARLLTFVMLGIFALATLAGCRAEGEIDPDAAITDPALIAR